MLDFIQYNLFYSEMIQFGNICCEQIFINVTDHEHETKQQQEKHLQEQRRQTEHFLAQNKRYGREEQRPYDETFTEESSTEESPTAEGSKGRLTLLLLIDCINAPIRIFTTCEFLQFSVGYQTL